MVFKIDFNVPKTLKVSVKKQVDMIIQDDKVLNEIGDLARKDAVAHILQGKNPATGRKFENSELSEKWQKRKKRLSTVNTPIDSRAGGSGKLARLAFTGQWLKSFTHKIVRKSSGLKEIQIGPEGTRTPYRNLNKNPAASTPTNEELGQYLLDQGRDWRGVSNRTRIRMNTAVRAYIRRKLRSRNS